MKRPADEQMAIGMDKSHTVFDRKFRVVYSRLSQSYINQDEWGTYITGYAPITTTMMFTGINRVDLLMPI